MPSGWPLASFTVEIFPDHGVRVDGTDADLLRVSLLKLVDALSWLLEPLLLYLSLRGLTG